MRETTLSLTLVGGPTVLIEYGSIRLLTDPTFDAPGHYQLPSLSFEKTSGPALTRDEVGRLDAVLLSHDQHIDNLDISGRAMLGSVGKTFTTQAGAQRLGGNAIGLAPYETCTLHGAGGETLLVTATPARHGPIGIEPISGDVVGFALGRQQPGDLLYVTGDTVWYEGTAEVARRFDPKVVVLFTGAAEPRGRFHMTMGSEGAIEAAHAFPNAALVSAHSEGWMHFRESQEQLADVFQKLNLAGRLTPFDKGTPVRFPIPA
ncbi:MBL fold metallo-hydrolase [Bordetella genomosp. 9]|uniref:MBL fold metallo-hydrolase n=1 Tax=Bordetella genomosp. 9 TaxID=1416803 RepID=A0A261RMZ5_9BORD|nr:MBL fold metallo-hydrolase [Bordetella genomosp. 9]OZI26428.1 MBL fold metallo-hydrolase [Bordetella genomosp. 9]